MLAFGACRRAPPAAGPLAVSSWTGDAAVRANGDVDVTETIDARVAAGATSFRRPFCLQALL